MSETGATYKLWTMVMIFSIVFPVVAYAFTTFESEIEDYDIDIDPEKLIIAGISIRDGISHNISWKSGWEYYNFPNKTIRASWNDNHSTYGILGYTDLGDGVAIQTQPITGRILNTWYLPYFYDMRPQSTDQYSKIALNDTIVINWQEEYGWSRFILEDGYQVFFTPYSTTENITVAVYTSAQLNCTIAISMDETGGTYNVGQFVSWYWGLMVGSNSFGLPPMFSWIIRVISALTLLSGILLAKAMLRL